MQAAWHQGSPSLFSALQIFPSKINAMKNLRNALTALKQSRYFDIETKSMLHGETRRPFLRKGLS
jgi:hypothetical protein